MLVATVPIRADDVVVVRKDGRSSAGKVIKDDDAGVTLEIVGIAQFIARQDIARVDYQKSVPEQFWQRRKKLRDDDLEGRYDLVKWLYEKKTYDLALAELNALISRFPADARLAQLRRNVLAEQKVAQTGRKREVARSSPADKQVGKGKIANKDQDTRLTPDQINLIRIWELRLSDRSRGVVVPRKVVNDVFEDYAHHDQVPKGTKARRRFRGLKGYEKLRLLLDLDARDLLRQVEVKDTGEPAALRTFRMRIHQQYVLNYCGTRSCHGADDAKPIRLTRIKSNQVRTAYTNFYTLNAYESKAGYMVDRDYPSRSLLLQYGLPTQDSSIRHPLSDRWRPYFRNRQDQMYIKIRDWIDTLMRPLKAKNYGIKYNPAQPVEAKSAETDPTGNKATQSSTEGSGP